MSEHIIPTYVRWPIKLVSGEGCHVTDSDGKTYLDLIAGLAVTSLGHAHPGLTTAIADQAARGTRLLGDGRRGERGVGGDGDGPGGDGPGGVVDEGHGVVVAAVAVGH